VVTSVEDARAAKKLVRKMKNREAAARSNLRRKQRDDALKTDVSEGRSRLQALGARERALRAENARLRTLLATARVTTLASDPVG
jgi:hypothetical protein